MIKSNNLQEGKEINSKNIEETLASVDYGFDDFLNIEHLEEIQNAFTMLNNIYAVIVDDNNKPRTKVTGPSKNIGEFFDIVEIKEFLQACSEFRNTNTEYGMLKMKELKFNNVKVSGVPIIMNKRAVGVWMICAGEDYDMNDFIRVTGALLVLVGNLTEFLYNSMLLAKDSGKIKRMHTKAQRLLEENRIYTDILEFAHNNEDGVSTIAQMLDKLGVYMDISRVILAGFNLRTVEFRGICDWCAKGFETKRVSIEKVSGEAVAYLYKRFSREDIVSVSSDNIPPELAKTFRQFSAGAAIMNMIEITDKFAYMLIYIDEREDKIWNDHDINKTKSIKKIIETIIIKKTSLDGLMNDWKIFKTILDNVDSCIYVQSESGLNILYINKKLKELFPDFKKNGLCWEILHGEEKPCENCYLRNEYKGIIKKWEVFSKGLNKSVAVSSVPVSWVDGSMVRIVTLREI